MSNEYLISADALASSPAAIVFDCRFSLTDPAAGSQAYTDGHIPGARYADLEHDLSGTPGPRGEGGRHPLPDRDALANRLRAWGVSDDSSIVCYDDNSGAFAGRFWWLLRWLGHGDVRVLDGGLDAWLAAGFDVDRADVAPTSGNFTVRPPLTRLRTAEDLLDDAVKLLDARDSARYRGEVEPFDARAGRIPGAISAPFSENLADGAFRSTAELTERFRKLGVDHEADTVCYCGSGVTAAHNILALLLAGYPEPALYAGSWSDWITDEKRPIATG